MSSVWKEVLILKFTKSFPPEVISLESSCFVLITKSDTNDAYCTIAEVEPTCFCVIDIMMFDRDALSVDNHVACDSFFSE